MCEAAGMVPQLARVGHAFRGPTCQAEAIPPDVLAQILRDAVEARIDHKALEHVRKRERHAQRELNRAIGKLIKQLVDPLRSNFRR